MWKQKENDRDLKCHYKTELARLKRKEEKHKVEAENLEAERLEAERREAEQLEA